MIKIELFPAGPYDVNCYLAHNEETKECVIVDPGGFPDPIPTYIKENELTLTAVLLTHGHFDHILGLTPIRTQYPDIMVCASTEESTMLGDPALNSTDRFLNYAVSLRDYRKLQDHETMTLLGETCEFLLTPGHTAGSGCYYFPSSAVLFSGDTLFRRNIGRTDLPTGDTMAILRSLDELKQLPAMTAVFPGHGEESTIGEEVEWNPYIR